MRPLISEMKTTEVERVEPAEWKARLIASSKLLAELLDENGEAIYEGFVNDCEHLRDRHNAALSSLRGEKLQSSGIKEAASDIVRASRQMWPEDAYVAWKREHEETECDGGTHCAFMAGIEYAEEFILSGKSNVTGAPLIPKPLPVVEPPLHILIYEQDGDQVDNRTYVGFKVRDREETADFHISWGWITADERQKARTSARRLATNIAAVTGLEIKEDHL